MELRQANPRRQGDIGEMAAAEWLTRAGFGVWIPLCHSPDVDLLAQHGDELIRVQVKTSTQRRDDRFPVNLKTCGGNQSWTGMVKRFTSARCDYLFVLVADGRKWFIPSHAVEGTTGIHLGGPKYSEFEVDCDQGRWLEPPLESESRPGEYPSGQRMRAVNASPYGFAGSNPASPITTRASPQLAVVGQARRPLRTRTRISRQHQITIPSTPFHAAGLQVGDRLRAEADGPGRVVLTRVEDLIAQQSLRATDEAGAA
jgi:PD-(D/E)XK endonuclease